MLSGKHPNLLTLIAVYEDKSRKLSVVAHISRHGRLSRLLVVRCDNVRSSTNDWRLVATQLLSAVSFMHSLGVVHRDIKPDNIMCKHEWTIDSEPHLQIIDFARLRFARRAAQGYHGTKFFTSPEMCNRGLYDEKTDNWAVGVVMIVLLTGYPEGVQVQETWQKLLRGIYRNL